MQSGERYPSQCAHVQSRVARGYAVALEDVRGDVQVLLLTQATRLVRGHLAADEVVELRRGTCPVCLVQYLPCKRRPGFALEALPMTLCAKLGCRPFRRLRPACACNHRTRLDGLHLVRPLR